MKFRGRGQQMWKLRRMNELGTFVELNVVQPRWAAELMEEW